jgi:nitrogen fixation protein FixH
MSGTSQKEFTGRHMLLIMIAFFGVIIAVNITMAVVARQSWTGLVAKTRMSPASNSTKKWRTPRRRRRCTGQAV